MNATTVEKIGRRYVLPPGPNSSSPYGAPLLGTTISAWCPVCNGPTVKIYRLAVVDLMQRFAAVCHGSVERAEFTDVAMMTQRYSDWPPDCVRQWLCTVFEADTQPDVMLAIRYGQGQTVKEGVK